MTVHGEPTMRKEIMLKSDGDVSPLKYVTILEQNGLLLFTLVRFQGG